MSSTSFSTRRQIWSNQHPLRKQRSFVDGGLISQASGGNLGRSERSKYSLLQKQYSVDQVYAKGSRQGRFNVLSTSCSSNSDNKQSVVVNKGIVARQWPIADDDTSEISLSSLTVKKKPQTKGYGDIKKDKAVGDRLKKSPKGNGDDKINLNIFLAQTITTENDGVSSDIDSPSESLDNLNKDTKIPTQNPQLIKKPNIIQAKPSPPPASTRRTQFQASRALENSSVTPTALISASPSLTIERRPPLVRAMSAPIRTLDENSKNILANKRKSRRRKVLGRAPNCDKPNVNVIESSIDENEENFGDKGRGKNKKSCGRTRSNLGCDVVTLVSLISSEGSDSEKEDSISPTEGPIKRAPLLRKAGKSVSFQEDDSPHFSSQGKEISHLLRRGSVAPLAARIRANRPPTAPPVSIFLSDFENSGSKMSDESKTPRKDDNPSNSPSTSDTKENNVENNLEGGKDNQFPDYVNTMKERECWKLFQKMLNKGVAVSYDTVLRGMLTPTELRLIQKQKELQESKKLAESIEIVEEEKN